MELERGTGPRGGEEDGSQSADVHEVRVHLTGLWVEQRTQLPGAFLHQVQSRRRRSQDSGPGSGLALCQRGERCTGPVPRTLTPRMSTESEDEGFNTLGNLAKDGIEIRVIQHRIHDLVFAAEHFHEKEDPVFRHPSV